MNLRCLKAFALCGALLLALSSSVEADGWFGSTSKPAANGVTTSGAKKSWWPSWTYSKPKPKTAANKKPSMLSSVTKGTKDTWNKTTSFLNPFDNPPKAPKHTAPETGANSSGWFSSNKPEKKEVATLGDFIGSERPKW